MWYWRRREKAVLGVCVGFWWLGSSLTWAMNCLMALELVMRTEQKTACCVEFHVHHHHHHRSLLYYNKTCKGLTLKPQWPKYDITYTPFLDELVKQLHHHPKPSNRLAYGLIYIPTDYSTLPQQIESQLAQSGFPLCAHSHKHCVDPMKVIDTPDYKFIHYEGFNFLRFPFPDFPTWLRERKPIVFWRGAANGRGPIVACRDIPRIDMVRKAKGIPWLDIRLSRQSACGVPKLKELVPVVNETEFRHYRATVSVDGWANAWGLYWKLISGGVVFKVDSPYCTFITKHLVPWKHYIPLKADFSDLANVTEIITSTKQEDLLMLYQIAKNAYTRFISITMESEVQRVAKNLIKIWQQ